MKRQEEEGSFREEPGRKVVAFLMDAEGVSRFSVCRASDNGREAKHKPVTGRDGRLYCARCKRAITF